ncbi:class E sortase [Actinospongicola halichondriae]|uniref:class E sortase n=1 Tax=Actinospongicola halichondriae TaxID=3236844 RepID=UPI003D4E43A5
MVTIAAILLNLVIGAGVVALTVRIQRADARVAQPTPPVAVAVPAAGPARQPENLVERLVVGLKNKKAARVALSTLSFALLLGAAGVIGYPFYTNLYQGRLQGQLDRQLASPELRDAYLNRSVAEGDSLTRIKIPRIGVDTVVVEGTTASALRAGAGHYPATPLPCEVGNVAIAGHRTTYGRPFHDLDQLQPGDRVTLETPVGECTYEVDIDPFIVMPNQTEVVDNTPDSASLTLTTCHPKGSARERLILKATMVSAETFDA